MMDLHATQKIKQHVDLTCGTHKKHGTHSCSRQASRPGPGAHCQAREHAMPCSTCQVQALKCAETANCRY